MEFFRGKVFLLTLALSAVGLCAGCSSTAATDRDPVALAESAWEQYTTTNPNAIYMADDATVNLSETVCTEDKQGITVAVVHSNGIEFTYRMTFVYNDEGQVSDIEVIPYAKY